MNSGSCTRQALLPLSATPGGHFGCTLSTNTLTPVCLSNPMRLTGLAVRLLRLLHREGLCVRARARGRGRGRHIVAVTRWWLLFAFSTKGRILEGQWKAMQRALLKQGQKRQCWSWGGGLSAGAEKRGFLASHALSSPRQLLSYITKDKQTESLVEKLCQRFRTARYAAILGHLCAKRDLSEERVPGATHGTKGD